MAGGSDRERHDVARLAAPVGTGLRTALLAACAVGACLIAGGMLVLQLRYVGAVLGVVPTTPEPAAPVSVAAAVASPSAAGQVEASAGASASATASLGAETNSNAATAPSVTVDASYASEAIALAGGDLAAGASAELRMDDRWFAGDPERYQHDLATSCAVLTAVCNAESQYYNGTAGAEPVAEQALYALGFHDVQTDSYRLRSDVLDELGALLTGESDVVAYTLASKTIQVERGQAATLVFVGMRGSYGSEWASNLNPLSLLPGSDDHRGFAKAAQEAEQALDAYVGEIGADPATVRVLVTGHSRGGAVANLLAARLDERAATGSGSAAAEHIYAYTFASPGTTRADNRSDASYDNIFNIVNESDIVPKLPLSTWGYGRYGTTVALPGADEGGFTDLFTRMCAAFQGNTGVSFADSKEAIIPFGLFSGNVEVRAEAAEREGADAIASESARANAARNDCAATRAIADELADPAELSTSDGLFGIVSQLLSFDLETAFASHLPDTYIAWMQTTKATDLTFE